ncbi:hypothetical protein EYC84_007557 [Monilinia fructicola]|uniref:Uncharacterized protein n=1 Tax=Monilinia fructicola TaxID=38448 RepID=A0A5M9JII7_MONFR|nr:hypothetical protein EYC84_007557 [Monilinia fructicola]
MFDAKMNEEALARRKDEEMRAQGMDHATDDEDVLFSYDPDEDGEQQNTSSKSDDYDEYDEYDEMEENEAAPVVTKDGFVDRINLDVYTSHQRVLSSDHKPLDAVFTLEYDAVVPELKSKVQQEVARDLDRAENEARPGITIVVDHSQDADGSKGMINLERNPMMGVEWLILVTSTFAFVDRPGVEGQEDRIAPPWLSGDQLNELIHIPEGGVRALLPRPRGEPGPPVNRGQEVTWSAPRELLKLTQVVDSLTDRVVADSNMLEGAVVPRDSPGWPFDEKTWRLKDQSARVTLKGRVLAALDADQSIFDIFPVEIPAANRLEILAEVLVLFLRSLTDGIIPATICEQIDADVASRVGNTRFDIEETKGRVLDVLSALPHHNISFVFLTSTLSRVAGELAPIPKVRRSLDTTVRIGFNSVKRTMSWKGRAAPPPEDPAAVRRRDVNRAFAEVFVGIVFRGSIPVKDRDKRILEEKRRDILEAFLKGLVP